MPSSEKKSPTGPEVAAFLGLLSGGMFLVAAAVGTFLELRKAATVSGQEDGLRQLVKRYEHLSDNALDAQQRAAADVAELRTRTAAIEQILRTVE